MEEDIKFTQGNYWGGSQIPFWQYAIAVVFGGFFGLDHLLLRSPWTALYKCLAFIIPLVALFNVSGYLCMPLCLFWYFYDIAQLGEWDLVKYYGIMTPMTHTGIGAGMFHTPGVTPADKSIPSPLIYLVYVVTSIIFVSLPINKLILGDTAGAMYQFVLLMIMPIAFAWGVYDIYRIFCDREGLFHKGQFRIPPATMQVLRLNPTTTWFHMDSYAKAGSIGPNGDYTYEVMLKDAAMGVVKGVVKGVEKGTRVVARSMDKIKCETPKVSTQVPIPLATPVAQTGGAILTNLAPRVSSSVLLFSVALLAFSGYVMYSFRKTYYKTTEDDDSPPDPRPVRGFTEARS